MIFGVGGIGSVGKCADCDNVNQKYRRPNELFPTSVSIPRHDAEQLGKLSSMFDVYLANGLVDTENNKTCKKRFYSVHLR